MRHPIAAPVILLALTLPISLAAQVADSSPFRRLDLPTPNATRGPGGAPGPHYWQNRADYRIEASLDTSTHEIRGAETITYLNNSPDTLRFIWLQMDQNIFGENSINRAAPPPPLLFAGVPFEMAVTGPSGGFAVDSLSSDHGPVATYLWDTMLRIDFTRALAPGDSARTFVRWRFTVPENGAARMGRDGHLYEIAQWYPRLAVYDDVNGWNTLPYTGAGEFYLEYGDFRVSLTVPATYIVAATGELRNAEAVLTDNQRTRLQRALGSEEPVAIITRGEAGTTALTRPHAGGTATWEFSATNVRDFAFAAASNFQWDAVGYDAGTSGRKLVQTFYRPGAANWDVAIRMARHAIKTHGERWFIYPYPQASAVEGPINGMEYPMIVFVPADTSKHSLSWVMMHELGHEWFPMTVGSDERRYPWMDEGFNSFIDLYTVADWWQGDPHADSVRNGPLTSYAENAIPGKEQPLITQPAMVHNLYWTAYQKPALMLRLLREEVLGHQAFDAAFRAYVRRWAFRHPQPADFFRTMANVSGRDLDWYWREWVYTTSRLDQAVDSVVPQRARTARGRATARELPDSYRIVLGNHREMMMPAEITLTWSDQSSENREIPVEMWNYGRRFAFTVEARGRRLVSVEIDPRHAYPDVDRRNNLWPKPRR
ncbi:MAG: M1 family metallopeptidase [Gemmatimonadales bacterium]